MTSRVIPVLFAIDFSPGLDAPRISTHDSAYYCTHAWAYTGQVIFAYVRQFLLAATQNHDNHKASRLPMLYDEL